MNSVRSRSEKYQRFTPSQIAKIPVCGKTEFFSVQNLHITANQNNIYLILLSSVLERRREESMLQLENIFNDRELSTMDQLEDLNLSQVTNILLEYIRTSQLFYC